MEDAEEPSYIDEADEVLGTQYCEPNIMKPAKKFNDVKKSALQLCVLGTFIPEGYQCGSTDAHWQSIEELVASISPEDFDQLGRQTTSRSFRRASSATQSASRRPHSLLVSELHICIHLYDNCMAIVYKICDAHA